MRQRVVNVIAVLALVLALLAIGYEVMQQPFEPEEARSYNTACYSEQGGANWVAGSGCTWSVESGATLAVDSGATVSIDGYVTSTVADLEVTSSALINKLDVTGTVTATSFVGNVTGNLTGNVTGNVNGDVTGDLTGDILGSSGTDIKDDVTITGTLDVAGASLNYGPNDLYPLGSADSGFQAKWGSTVITATANVVHGLTGPVMGVCSIGAELVDNEEQVCSVKISGSTVSIYVYKEAGAAGDSGVKVYWLVLGTP